MLNLIYIPTGQMIMATFGAINNLIEIRKEKFSASDYSPHPLVSRMKIIIIPL